MDLTAHHLTRAAGVSAAVSGALFIGVQVKHPHLDSSSIQTTEMMVREGVKQVMAALSLVGLTGMYLSQVRRNGLLGLVGYVVLGLSYLSIMATNFAGAFVLPAVAKSDPGYVDDVIAVIKGDSPAGDLGVFGTVIQLQGFGYLVGGVLFGVALFRAGVLARWATALLALGGLVTVALSVMPDAFYRLLALPNGIAMIGLGVSLWTTQRAASLATSASSATSASTADAAPVR